MRVTPDIVVLVICGLLKPTDSTWIFEGIPSHELDEARDIGRKAKVEFVSRVVGETDHFKRNSHYLDGLEKCNDIDREWTDNVLNDALRHGNVENAVWLQKAGMKEFTALFMTLPPYHMDRIAKSACAKHEKQLTCGAEYEGRDTTMKRVADLKRIGNHKMMFERECSNKDFVTRIYPCVGQEVSNWIRPCSETTDRSSVKATTGRAAPKSSEEFCGDALQLNPIDSFMKVQVNAYSAVRDSVNQRISSTYDTAVAKVKATVGEDRKDDLRTFEKAMTSIAFLEGSKCGLFKQMRVCVLRRLLEKCGPEAMKAFNTSISLGYLRTERRERLNLDFEVFNYPVHPNCIGL